jgi:hypothetical protein
VDAHHAIEGSLDSNTHLGSLMTRSASTTS